jgi:hypothetical protein
MPDFVYIPTPQPGARVQCDIAARGICPDSDCPHYGPHECGVECLTDECFESLKECVKCRDDEREDG